MELINTKNWKQFLIGNLFNSIVKPEVYHTRHVKEDSTGVNYIVRTKFNNGIKYRVKIEKNMQVNPPGTISFGAENATFFYQEEPWISGRDIYYIDTTKYSKSECLFLVSVLRTITDKYSYNYGLFPKLLKQEKILLPVDSKGNPDWQYMDDYMRNVQAKVDNAIECLKKNRDYGESIVSVDGWKNFVIDDMFQKLDLKILKNDFDKKIDVSLVKNNEFNLPVVNAKHFNNGIMFYGREDDFEWDEMTIDIVQNGAIATGDVYAQPQKTGVLWDAYLVKPKWNCTSRYVLHYISCVMEKCIKQCFSYDNKCVWDKVRYKTISLPVNLKGDPDWDYMENYMRGIERIAKNNLAALKSVVAE